MDARRTWQTALGELQLQLTKATFDTWLKDTTGVACEDGVIVVAVRNAYAKDWLENRLYAHIARTLASIVGRTVEVRFMVNAPALPSAEADPEEPAEGELFHRSRQRPAQAAAGARSSPAMLNPRYTFDTYVVGNANRLAHAASLAVAESPGASYNPLFLYGGVGLGKTHLLHAIGHRAMAMGCSVLYVSSETFTNEMINAIRTQSTEAFRGKYRHNNVLLIDDIQFIAGKESTQEEFFHTFNALHAASSQIVLTSDRPPKAIPTLEERLRSRFEWGLLADIQPPDLEMRIAILRAKAESLGAQVPPGILDYVARKVQSNIRELEGALNRIIAHARMMGLPYTEETAAAALRDVLMPAETLPPEQIIEAVCRYYEVRREDLSNRRRNREIVAPRQMAMYLLREEAGISLSEIGGYMGGRDHTTVLHACNKIAAQIEEDERMRRELLAIREALYQGKITPVRV
ncbi:MAG TPA: chromosomal replication initiator protein DnaA [Anaerolineae bacterium]|nr:chromosomal replication initiator protein DnaA [Anaerolineae bacterium]HOR00371.1 chromosomal replication initiator protein DnaA [Anaerolineae bacterium]HPL28511.1 chromosomal replication initiator protein DnaA [Anaerolineae bacterium]